MGKAKVTVEFGAKLYLSIGEKGYRRNETEMSENQGSYKPDNCLPFDDEFFIAINNGELFIAYFP